MARNPKWIALLDASVLVRAAIGRPDGPCARLVALATVGVLVSENSRHFPRGRWWGSLEYIDALRMLEELTGS